MSRAAVRRSSRRRSRRFSGLRLYRPPWSLQLSWRPPLLPLAGAACVVGAAALVNWVIAPLGVVTSVREAFVEALGVGVFLIIGLVLLLGLWIAAGARWRLGSLALRRLAAGLLLGLFAVGIAGLFRPHWDLGGVDLGRVTVGGEFGDALTSPIGAFVMLGLATLASMLIAPRATIRFQFAVATLLAQMLRPPLRRLWRIIAERYRRATHRPAIAADTDQPTGSTSPASLTHKPAAADPPQAATDAAPASDEAEQQSTTEKRASARSGKRRRSADGWQLPSLDLLRPDAPARRNAQAGLQAQLIVDTLASFGVDARISDINEGPSVTRFGIEPGWEVRMRKVTLRDESGRPLMDGNGQLQTREEEVSRTRVRVSKITRLSNDLALALAAPSIRMEAPVPGKPVIGIEVPNRETRLVSLRGVLESPQYRKVGGSAAVAIALGRAVTGAPVVADLAQMPHLLIAGATGSGKSVGINTFIVSLLMHFSPEQLRLVLVDPKRVELTGYGDVPHLVFSRVITEPDELVGVLGVVVTEMERRYRRFESEQVRNITVYNEKDRPEGNLPYWVVVIDELADLMMTAPVEVEQQLVRLAQLARATGIFLVIATQRPSVDVVTGLIKANFPTRIAYATSSQTDSRVILDRAGAEKLLGRGDMLFLATDSLQPRRVQGCYVSDDEIRQVIDFWTQDRFTQIPRPTLDHQLEEAVRTAQSGAAHSDGSRRARDGDGAGRDALYDDAHTLALDHTRVSASLLQRRLRIGYPRAARLIDDLESAGVIGAAEGGQSRRVLAGVDEREPS